MKPMSFECTVVIVGMEYLHTRICHPKNGIRTPKSRKSDFFMFVR